MIRWRALVKESVQGAGKVGFFLDGNQIVKPDGTPVRDIILVDATTGDVQVRIPTIHEALSHLGEDEGVEVTTCRTIAKSGYRIGERVVRAAQVLVVDPPAGG